MTNKPKVLVIFPRYSTTESTHYPYWYRLFATVAQDLDLKILFESGTASRLFPISHTVQQVSLKPFNLLERLYLIVKYVRLGYRHIYIHYSLASVLLCRLLSPIFQLRVYYWHCRWYQSDPHDPLLKIALKLTDVFVTGSQLIGEQYRHAFTLGPKPIKIVPNYASLDSGVGGSHKSKIMNHESEINILYVHTLAPLRGSHDLPDIIRLTSKEFASAHFHIVGTGPDLNWLMNKTSKIARIDRSEHSRRLASTSPNSQVTFYGSLPHAQVIDLCKKSDYFIMPSHSEGFPRVILEAMLYRLPFVATNVGNVTEIVPEVQKPFLVPPARPKLFAKTLIKLIKSPNQSSIVKANYQQVTQKYGLTQAQTAFVGLFQV